MKAIISIVLLVVITTIGGNIVSSLQHELVTVKVVNVIDQTNYSKNGEVGTTEHRYLVVTDKETFECKNSLLNFHFNKSDVFYHIQKDSTYTFDVVGFGKSFFTDYRNIIEIE